MAKGAISKTEYSTDRFISNIFLVPKKNGKLRPVINWRQLNEFVEYHHFKQENLKSVLDLVPKFDYLTSVDLCDAYFSIQIHPEFQKYLCFWTVMRAGGLAPLNLIQHTISLEMPVPSQGHYGVHSFPVVDWFCLFI